MMFGEEGVSPGAKLGSIFKGVVFVNLTSRGMIVCSILKGG